MSAFAAMMLASIAAGGGGGPASFVGAAVLGGGTSFSSSAVAGCAAGDIALLFLADDQTTNCDVTTGWTADLDLEDGYGESSAYIGFWIKELTSSDCSASIANTTSSTSGILAVFRGTTVAALLAAIHEYRATSGANTTSNPSSSSITNGTYAADDISLIVGMCQDSTSALSAPANWTIPTNGTESGGSGSTSSRIAIATRTSVTGTVSPGNWTGQSSGNFLTNLHIRLPSA